MRFFLEILGDLFLAILILLLLAFIIPRIL